MSTAPALPAEREASRRAVRRTSGFAAFSGWTMIVLGGISALTSVLHPFTVTFAISVAVLINGLIERRCAVRLRALEPRATTCLALNQIAVGLEVAAYALWQSHALSPEVIEAMLARPLVATLLQAYPPELIEEMHRLLPDMVRGLYLLVAVLVFVGCAGTALYYHSRARHVRMLISFPSSHS